MKNIVKRIIPLVLAVLMLAAVALNTGAELTDATVKSYEEQIAGVAKKIAQAQNELAAIHNEQSSTWQEINKLDELISYNDELKRLAEGQLETINQQIIETKAIIEDTEAKLASQDEAFKNRMLNTYMDGNIDNIELILGSENIVDFLTRVDRVRAIIEYDKSIIKDLKEKKKELDDSKKKLAEAEETLKLRVKEFESVIKENQAIYQTKLDRMAQLNNNENDAKATQEYYTNLDKELNAELEEYLRELQKKSQSMYVGGEGGWPLDPGAYYYVSSEQGWRNLYGVQDYHLGIDLACANGTRIYSYNAGTVLVSAFHYSYGNYVLIDHGGGISTLYAHLSERTVAKGDYVTAGQLVGYCGLTGNTFGYHLHFEVRVNGSVVNPRGYLVFP